MITWRETIDIIKMTFNILQEPLAGYLHIDAPTLSKIRNGTAKASFDYNTVFNDVFDPKNKDSLACTFGGTEDDLLSMLKEIIETEFKDVQKALADYDYWNITDYKSFVLNWLRRTRTASASKNCNNTGGLKLPAETPDKQMVRIFEQAISEYHIPTYIYNLPNYLMDGFPLSDQHSDMENFIKLIQYNLEKFFVQQSEDVFIKIREFNHALESYNELCLPFLIDVLDRHGIIWRTNMNIADDHIIAAIDSECAEIENNLHHNAPEEKDEIKKELFQLGANREIIALRKQLCELFEEICPGKHLIVF